MRGLKPVGSRKKEAQSQPRWQCGDQVEINKIDDDDDIRSLPSLFQFQGRFLF